MNLIGAKLVNRYEILRELGRGGMGVVYLAHDPLLERQVAIKLITPTVFNTQSEERFKRETRIVAKMDHPAIVVVYDVGEHEGAIFYVMPYVEGETLRVLMQEHALQLGEIIDIGIQVAGALEYSHSRGVVHRDIKPENIMVIRTSGGVRVRIMDFGLAINTTEHRLTEAGVLIGTVAYLSPEQLTAEDVDGRADIYSLGAVLYECLADQPPFIGNIKNVFYRIMHEKPTPLREMRVDINRELEAIVMQCLEKLPAKRPQRGQELADTLTRLRGWLVETEQISSVSYGSYTLPSESQSLTVQYRHPALLPAMPTFVGREKELTQLQHMLTVALMGECLFALVTGQSGIGKSCLLDRLENLAKERNARVLHGRFVEQDHSFPYQGFCEVIQEYFCARPISGASALVDFSDLAAELIALFPVLAEIGALRAGAGENIQALRNEDRTYIFELLARALGRIARSKPLLILLENLHDGDVAIDALQYIVRRLGPTATLIVGTYRSTEVDKQHTLTRMLNSFQGDRRFSLIKLAPFSRAEHQAFVEANIGATDLEKEFLDRLYEATEGNPFFTQELLRSLADTGKLTRDTSGHFKPTADLVLESEALPTTIQQAVEKRVERLSAELREVLSIAAVLGKSFEFDDLVLLAHEQPDLENAIDELIKTGLIEEDKKVRGDRLTFSSVVVRDVLYTSLSRRRRRSLHRSYAEELEKRRTGRLEQVYPQLVYHYSQGDVAEKVVEYGLLLAKRSLDALSVEDALRVLKVVLDFLSDEKEQLREAEAHILLAQAYRIKGDIGSALRELELTIKISTQNGEHQQTLRAIELAAEIAWASRHIDETVRWVEKGLDVATELGNTASLVKFFTLGATVANLRGEYDRAKEYLSEVARLQPPNKLAEKTIAQGGNLVVALTNAVRALHPIDIKLLEEAELLPNVFETLLTTDMAGNLIPALCERWEILDGGKVFLLTLRQDVRWQNGRTLMAMDVKASIEAAIKRSSFELPAAYAAIAGSNDYRQGATTEVTGVKIVSDWQLRIELSEPLPIYAALLTDVRTAVAYKESNDSPTDRDFIGTGPFKFAFFTSTHVLLAGDENYWRGKGPLLDTIEFRSTASSAEMAAGLRDGVFDVARDLLPEDLEEVLRDKHLRAGLVEAPKKNIYFCLFNSSSLVGQSAEFRQALFGAVRTHDLVRRTLGRFAQPAEGLLPPGILGHDPGRRRQPLSDKKVMQLLSMTGSVAPIRLKAAMHPSLRDRYASLISALCEAWRELGVEVSTDISTMTSYLQSQQQNTGIDLFIGRWIADYNDPDNFTYGLFHSCVGRLRNYYCSPELDRLVEEARLESNTVARTRLYQKIEDLLLKSNFVLPLFHDIDYCVANAKVWQLTLSSSPPYVNYSNLGKLAESSAPAVVRKRGGIIQIPIVGEMQSLDPSLVTTVIQSQVTPTIFETLLCQSGGTIVPWLASEVRAEAGSRRFRFRLRENVRFQDGRRLTARDVRYSFERLLHNSESDSRWFFSPIRGAQALLNGEKEELEGFEIISATEFSIALEQPVSFFPALVAYYSAAIVPEGSERFDVNWRQGCIGTGAFRITRFEPGRRLELEANPHYWRPDYPKSDGMVFTFGVTPAEQVAGFRTQRFSLAWDLFPEDVEALRHEGEFQYLETPRLCTYFLIFNIHRGVFADERLRHWLTQAIDVARLVRQLVGRLGMPAHGLIPPGLLGYDPARTMNGLAAPTGQAVVNVDVKAIVNPIYRGPYSAFLAGLLDCLNESGFHVQLLNEAITDSYYQLLETGEAELAIARWIGDYPDADTFVHGLLHSREGHFGTLCGDPELDRLIEQARNEIDPAVRHAIYGQVEEILQRRAILLPLFYEQAYRLARPEVTGFEINFFSPVVSYEKLSIRR
ncbi:MAG: ABC transporter substrate-binding protein [Acidobacteriota bacterium]